MGVDLKWTIRTVGVSQGSTMWFCDDVPVFITFFFCSMVAQCMSPDSESFDSKSSTTATAIVFFSISPPPPEFFIHVFE